MFCRIIKTLLIGLSIINIAAADPDPFANTYNNDVDSVVIQSPVVNKTLSLNEAIFLALRYNLQITNQELTRIVQKFNLRVAENAFELHYALNGGMNTARTKANGVLSHSQNYTLQPSMSLNTDIGTNISLTQDNISDGTFYNPGVTLEVKQPLLRGANPAVVLAPLLNQYDQEVINRLSLRSNTITQVVTVINQYRLVIATEENLKIQEESLKRAEANLTVTQKLINAGQKAQMELAQAEQGVAQSRFAIIQSKNSLAQAKQTLLTTIGLDPYSNITIPDVIPTPHYQLPDLRKSIDIALANDPAYQSDLLNLRIARRQLLVARDGEKWQLNADAKARWGYGSGGPPNNDWTSVVNGQNTSEAFGVTLSIPFNDLSIEQTIVSAQVALQTLEASTQFDKRAVVANVMNSIRNLKTDVGALQEAQLELGFQRQNLANTYIQFKVGQSTQFDVTQQQVALTQSQQTVLSSQIQLLNDITNYGQILQITLDEWKIKLRY